MKKVLVFVSAVGLIAAGCGVFGGTSDDDSPVAEPPPGSDPGATQPPPPPLQGAPVPSELTEEFGVFVAPNGTADGLGTRAKPLAGVQAAIDRAKANARRVYVCQGTYKEALVLANGVSVIGGFDCSNPNEWKALGGKSRLEASTSPAVTAAQIDHPTRFEGFEVVAPDGADGSPSSIALLANEATALTVAHATLRGGKGFDGANGTEGVQLTLTGNPDGQPGRQASSVMHIGEDPFPACEGSRAGGKATCAGAPGHDPEAGGAGGCGGTLRCTQTAIVDGHPILTWDWAVELGAGGKGTICSFTTPGKPTGAAGAAGTDGPSATAMGQLGADGYVTADGVAGTDGSPGHAGRGGSPQSGVHGGDCSAYDTATYFYAACGGGGGAGGCPGLAGTPGKGGGASIAALVVASPGLTFDSSLLASGQGGAGGKGTIGSSATIGGAGGTSYLDVIAASGGAGGRAGMSGSGAGGPSYALAFSTGAEPSYVGEVTFQHGEGGAGVAEATAAILGGSVTLPASVGGEAADKHAF